MSDDVGLGCFEGMYEGTDEPVLKPEWVVRVGRAEDAEGYKYVTSPIFSSKVGELTTDVTRAHDFGFEKAAWTEALHWTFGHGHDRNSVVRYEPGYLNVIQGGFIGDDFCCIVQCDDYDHYRRLPAAVSFEDRLLSRTGWNSDLHQAYYKSNVLLAKKV